MVVIVEDDAGAAEALATIIADWGAEVVHGLTPEDALGKLGNRVGSVDHVITDFHLGPGPDGVSLVHQLTDAAPKARVLVLSGSFHGRASAAAANAGFEVMSKPARAEKIVAWLERV